MKLETDFFSHTRFFSYTTRAKLFINNFIEKPSSVLSQLLQYLRA